jgi:hypothetical protein
MSRGVGKGGWGVKEVIDAHAVCDDPCRVGYDAEEEGRHDACGYDVAAFIWFAGFEETRHREEVG